MTATVTPAEFDRHDDLPDWRVVLGQIEADFTGRSFTAAAALVSAIAGAADRADHHPDVQLRYPGCVHVMLVTHAAGGLTEADVALAGEISALARAAGFDSNPVVSSQTGFAIDALDIAAVRPFWKAVLGYDDQTDPTGSGEPNTLVDLLRHGPSVWFQQMDSARPQRNRIHIDVNVPHDIADARVAAAVAAGGTVVDDSFARSWWVLADAEGNEACICTWQDRT